jgi:hypothetical protein
LVGVRITHAVESIDRESDKDPQESNEEAPPPSIKGLILGSRRMFEWRKSHRIMNRDIGEKEKRWRRA